MRWPATQGVDDPGAGLGTEGSANLVHCTLSRGAPQGQSTCPPFTTPCTSSRQAEGRTRGSGRRRTNYVRGKTGKNGAAVSGELESSTPSSLAGNPHTKSFGPTLTEIPSVYAVGRRPSEPANYNLPRRTRPESLRVWVPLELSPSCVARAKD